MNVTVPPGTVDLVPGEAETPQARTLGRIEPIDPTTIKISSMTLRVLVELFNLDTYSAIVFIDLKNQLLPSR